VGKNFLVETPKGLSLDDFMHFEPLCVQICSRVFTLGDWMKKGHYKNSQKGFILPFFCGEFPTQPNSTKICISKRKRKYDHITSTLRDDLHWLPIRQ